MTWALSFNKQARSEIREAAHYYGLESPSLRVVFLDAIDTALAELLEYPKSAPVVRGDISAASSFAASPTAFSTHFAQRKFASWR